MTGYVWTEFPDRIRLPLPPLPSAPVRDDVLRELCSVLGPLGDRAGAVLSSRGGGEFECSVHEAFVLNDTLSCLLKSHSPEALDTVFRHVLDSLGDAVAELQQENALLPSESLSASLEADEAVAAFRRVHPGPLDRKWAALMPIQMPEAEVQLVGRRNGLLTGPLLVPADGRTVRGLSREEAYRAVRDCPAPPGHVAVARISSRPAHVLTVRAGDLSDVLPGSVAERCVPMAERQVHATRVKRAFAGLTARSASLSLPPEVLIALAKMTISSPDKITIYGFGRGGEAFRAFDDGSGEWSLQAIPERELRMADEFGFLDRRLAPPGAGFDEQVVPSETAFRVLSRNCADLLPPDLWPAVATFARFDQKSV